MGAETIWLENKEWRNLVYNNKCTGIIEDLDEETEIEVYYEFTEIECKPVDMSSRHTAEYRSIFQRKSDGKYFEVYYKTPKSDNGMMWEDCNIGDTEINEVFPKTIETIVYE